MFKSKFVRAATVAVAIVAVAAGMSACSGKKVGDAGNADSANKSIKICMYTHGDGGTFWAVVQKGAEDAAKSLGVTLDYQGSTNDSSKQASTIQAGVSGGCNGIAASAPDPGAIKDAMLAAQSAGIPTVTLNSGSAVYKDLGAFTHIGQDETVAGKAAGDKFNELGVKKVLCVVQEQANVGLQDRCNGAKSTFKGTLQQFNADGALADLNGAEAKIEAALKADPSIDGVFALTADVATGAVLPAVQASGRDIKVGTVDLSADTLTAIDGGKISFAIDQQQYAQGFLAVQALYLAIKDAIQIGGGEPVYTGPAFVTKDNVKAVQNSVKAGTR